MTCLLRSWPGRGRSLITSFTALTYRGPSRRACSGCSRSMVSPLPACFLDTKEWSQACTIKTYGTRALGAPSWATTPTGGSPEQSRQARVSTIARFDFRAPGAVSVLCPFYERRRVGTGRSAVRPRLFRPVSTRVRANADETSDGGPVLKIRVSAVRLRPRPPPQLALPQQLVVAVVVGDPHFVGALNCAHRMPPVFAFALAFAS